jgi:release factor glutamine methyltransferase
LLIAFFSMGLLQPKSLSSWTIRQALAWAGSCLRAKGLPDSRLSAELLLGSVLGLDRLGLIIHANQSLDEKEGLIFQEKVLRRAGHEPIAYLTGHKEFWSLNFEVNPNVLIPRPETEMLVDETLSIVSTQTGPMTLVELGTGCGAISIALSRSLKHLKTTVLIATDLSQGALRTAQKNAALHRVEKNIHFVQGDWLRPFSSHSRWIDLLVSNPPYISELELFSLPETVKGYEPVKALSGGLDGLESLRQIFHQAVTQLKTGGWLLLEIGETQGPQVLTLAQEHHFNPTTILRDHAGKDRVLKACYHG